jgi:hypothetical protein
MRRQRSGGIRFFSAFLALAAVATMFTATGNRLTQDANAFSVAQINLVTSPASIDVAPFLFSSPLPITVSNQTGKFARITGITLGNGFYSISTPTTCAVGVTLAPLNTCIITLIAAAS